MNLITYDVTVVAIRNNKKYIPPTQETCKKTCMEP